jgi:hypothetical protein
MTYQYVTVKCDCCQDVISAGEERELTILFDPSERMTVCASCEPDYMKEFPDTKLEWVPSVRMDYDVYEQDYD